ncbi:MAG TPA: tetratricopeptide repeat protein, partial [bacterium]|nr:tetratricopeptide repeat protein [bacterium]
MQAPDDASVLPDEIARQLAEYRQALDLPELDVGLDVAVWFHTGQSHRASGQIESAVACFKKVIELAPGDAFAYWELVDLYVEQGVPPAAVMVLSALGEQLSGGQEWIGAIAAWERASELAPDDADVLKALRDAYTGAGNPHEAGRVESALETLRPAAPTAAKAPVSKPAAPPAPGPAQDAAPPATPAAPPRPAPARRSPPPAEPKAPPGPQPGKKPAPASFDKPGRDARGNGPGRLGSAGPGSHAAERGKNWPRETRLGEICLSHGWVTEEQMRRANEIQRQSNARMGRILVEMDAISEQQLSQALAEQWRLRYIDLADTVVDSEVARLIPSYLARRHGVVAIGREGNRLVVAMSDPSNVVAIDDIRLLTGLEVEVVIASAADIAKAQGLVYGGGGDMEEMFRAE